MRDHRNCRWFLSTFSMVASSRQEFSAEHLFRTYPGLIVAMASGFFGATFSMLLQSRNRASQGTLEDLSAASSWTTLTVRGAVGLGAAAILCTFFFRSGLIDGNLWPDIDKLGFDMLGEVKEGDKVDLARQLVANEDWCLLIIWCFVAGFSETFRAKYLGPDGNEKSSYWRSRTAAIGGMVVSSSP